MDPPISPENIVRPSYHRTDHPTGHNRFRQIFRDPWDRWCDLRMDNEVPADQRAYVTKIILRMMLCRDPEGVYARYICSGCEFEHRVPFSCKTRFCLSCSKVPVDNWVNNITKDILDPSPAYHADNK